MVLVVTDRKGAKLTKRGLKWSAKEKRRGRDRLEATMTARIRTRRERRKRRRRRAERFARLKTGTEKVVIT